jgi:hypothetical protein
MGQTHTDRVAACRAAASAIGANPNDGVWRDDGGNRVFMYRNKSVTIAFSKSTNEILGVVHSGFVSARMRLRPSQANFRSTDSEWHEFGRGVIQRVWPGTQLVLKSVRRLGEKGFDGKAWSSVSNTVVVKWETVPYGGYKRFVSVQFDRGTGTVISASRSPRRAVQ